MSSSRNEIEVTLTPEPVRKRDCDAICGRYLYRVYGNRFSGVDTRSPPDQFGRANGLIVDIVGRDDLCHCTVPVRTANEEKISAVESELRKRLATDYGKTTTRVAVVKRLDSEFHAPYSSTRIAARINTHQCREVLVYFRSLSHFETQILIFVTPI